MLELSACRLPEDTVPEITVKKNGVQYYSYRHYVVTINSSSSSLYDRVGQLHGSRQSIQFISFSKAKPWGETSIVVRSGQTTKNTIKQQKCRV